METQVRYRRGYERADCRIAVGEIMSTRDGQWWIVIRADQPVYDDEGQQPWSQEYEARPCTAEEKDAACRGFAIAKLEKELRGIAGPPDDERMRPEIEARRAAIGAELAALAD